MLSMWGKSINRDIKTFFKVLIGKADLNTGGYKQFFEDFNILCGWCRPPILEVYNEFVDKNMLYEKLTINAVTGEVNIEFIVEYWTNEKFMNHRAFRV